MEPKLLVPLNGSSSAEQALLVARGVERMLLGSVADKIIRGASQAVLLVPTLSEEE